MPESIRRAISVAALSLLVALPISAAKTPTASDLLRKAVKAMGGPQVVDSVKNIELHGVSKRVLPSGEEWSLTMGTYYVFPERYRQEATLPIGGTLITIVSPAGAFMQSSEMGGVELPKEHQVEVTRTILRHPIALLQRRAKVQASVEGNSQVNGKQAVLVRLTEEMGSTTLALDARTGQILQIRYPTVGGAGMKPAELTINYSDFRPVGKLIYPFSSEGIVDGKPVFSFELNEVLVNRSMDEKLFIAEVTPEEPAAPTQAAPAETGPASPPPVTQQPTVQAPAAAPGAVPPQAAQQPATPAQPPKPQSRR